MAKCPAHDDKNGSLHITEKDGGLLMHCFAGCEFDEVIAAVGVEKKDFPFPGGSNRPPQNRWKYGVTLQEYAMDRLYSIDALKSFGLSDAMHATKNGRQFPCIDMPYLDADGKLLKVRKRVLLHKHPEDKFTRFIWSNEGNPLPLYGLWKQPGSKKYVILVEGESDCQALWQAGLSAIGVPGASNYSEENHQTTLDQYETIYVHLEKDSGGLTMWNRFTGDDGKHDASPLMAKMRFFYLPEDYKDPSDLWQQLRGDASRFVVAMRDAVRKAKPASRFQKPDAWNASRKAKGNSGRDQRATSSAGNGSKGGAESHSHGGRPPADYQGLARAFFAAELLQDGLPKLRHWRNQWYRYDGRCYNGCGDADVAAQVMSYLQRNGNAERFGVQASNSAKENVLANLKSYELCSLPAETPISTWISSGESAGNWLPMENCALDITKAMLYDEMDALTSDDIASMTRPLSPDLLVTTAMVYPFDHEAKCPMFMDWLASTLPDPDVQNMVQMMVGLLLVPDTSYNVCFFFYGQGGTGKSTFLEILRKVIGDDNICRVPLLAFENRFATFPLAEKLVNMVGEMATDDPQGKLRYIEGDFKDSVSGGMVNVEHKGKDAISAPCIARHVFATNALPVFFDKSEGIWDRLRIIPFTQRFRGTQRENRNIAKDIVAKELSGIFLWALHGLRQLRELKTFPEPLACQAAKMEHRRKCDVEGTYARENYEIVMKEEVNVAVAYEHFTDYLQKAGLQKRSQQKLVDAMLRIWPDAEIATGNSGYKVFKNLHLKVALKQTSDF